MTPTPSDVAPPDPTMTDPMLRVLHQRHPEVDIVVLPHTAPPRPAPALSDQQRADLASDLGRSLDELLAKLVLDPVAVQVTRDATWRTDEWDQTWLECVAVVGPLARGANISLLRAAGRSFVGLGWQARPVPGDRPRLAARHRRGFEAAGAVRPDSLVLTLRTPKLRIAEEEGS